MFPMVIKKSLFLREAFNPLECIKNKILLHMSTPKRARLHSFSLHINRMDQKATASPSFLKEWRSQNIIVNLFGTEVAVPIKSKV
jgi:hypothetical protein